jgi:hypothetical protein
MRNLVADLRFALRTLAKSPVFTGVAVLSLALGIGANTAIFSLINAVILRTLPVSHPEQLVQLAMKSQGPIWFTNPIWEQVRDRQDVFSGAFAYSPTRLNLAVGGEVRNANTSWVSGDFFRTLGVNPLLGRTIIGADDKRGCPVIGVLSYDFWQREYGGAAGVLQRRLTLDSHPVPIVGVYMAWRGKTLMGPSWFTFVSLWGRRNTANRSYHRLWHLAYGIHDPVVLLQVFTN